MKKSWCRGGPEAKRHAPLSWLSPYPADPAPIPESSCHQAGKSQTDWSSWSPAWWPPECLYFIIVQHTTAKFLRAEFRVENGVFLLLENADEWCGYIASRELTHPVLNTEAAAKEILALAQQSQMTVSMTSARKHIAIWTWNTSTNAIHPRNKQLGSDIHLPPHITAKVEI